MKKIKIFLASSITDLKVDRIEVGDFVRQLNEIYLDRGVYFSLIKCDDYDNAIAAEGKQSQFDREIRDSELCFFLFFKKVGDYTRHEFEVALDAFKNSQKPKIVTYFKYIDTPKEAEGDVRAFMHMLDGEIKHYYNIYQSIDTLKLGMLMQIKLMNLDVDEPVVENGKVTFGGIEIADTRNLPVFSGNQTLAELKARLEKATKDYYELREQYQRDRENEDLYNEYSNAASEKKKLEDQLRNAEKAVLEASKRMYEVTGKGNLSARQVAAYRAFEQGDYKGALEILDFDAIMADLAHNEEIAEGYIERIQINVNELLQRIEVLEADGMSIENTEAIRNAYETVYDKVKKYDLKKNALVGYIEFLERQEDLPKALAVAEKLKYYYSDPDAAVNDDERACLMLALGEIYLALTEFSQAEESLFQAVQLLEKLYSQDPQNYGLSLAKCYMQYGTLCRKNGKFKEAVNFLAKGCLLCSKHFSAHPNGIRLYMYLLFEFIDISDIVGQISTAENENLIVNCKKFIEEHYKKEPEKFLLILAKYDISVGKHYLLSGRENLGYEKLRQGVERYRELVERNPEAYERYLAEALMQLSANLATDGNSESEELISEAISIYERLSKRNPNSYEGALAMCYQSLGDLQLNAGSLAEAETSLIKALDFWNRLITKSPDSGLIAGCYQLLGDCYRAMGKYQKSEMFYQKSIETARLISEEGNACKLILAKGYADLGYLYKADFKDEGKASEYFKSAVAILSSLPKEQSPGINLCLAEFCCAAADSFANLMHYREALRYLDLAIETYIKLPQEENEEALASLFNNKGFFLCELSENLELGIDCSKKSVALYEKLFSEEKCLVWEVANAYDTLADLYQKTGNDTEWLEAAKKAYEHALKCPEDEFCKKIIEKYERRLEK